MPQSLTLEYSQPFGLNGVAEVAKVTTDALGNVYTIGAFRGSVDFDPSNRSQILTSARVSEIFIRKQNSNGDLTWVKQLAAADNNIGVTLGLAIDRIGDLGVDRAGNVYAIGDFGLGKWDSSGNALWLNSSEGPRGEIAIAPKIYIDPLDAVYTMTVSGFIRQISTTDGSAIEQFSDINTYTDDISFDSAGNIYDIGFFIGQPDFDPTAQVSRLNSDNGSSFIRKLNRNRELVWVKQFGRQIPKDRSLVVGSDGIYFSGSFRDTIDFDPGAGSTTLQAGSNENIFISKLNLDGNFLWAKNFNPNRYRPNHYIDIDNNSNIYITGEFSGTTDFDPGNGVANLTAQNPTGLAINTFVSKLDPNGNFIWAKQFNGVQADNTVTSINIDLQGNVLTTGLFYSGIDIDPGSSSKILSASNYSDGFLSKLDNSGNFVWGQQFGSQLIFGSILAGDNRGNLYFGGALAGTIDFTIGQQQVQISSAGRSDALISQINATGQIEWIKAFGGLDFDSIEEIKVDRDGTISAIGAFRGTVDFDPGSGVFNLTSRFDNKSDSFIVRLDANGNFITAQLRDYVTPVQPTEFSDRFGGRYTVTQTNPPIFNLTKYDSNNQIKWSEVFTGTLSTDIDIDRDGNIYTLGADLTNRNYVPVLRKYSQPKPKAEIFWHNDRNGYSSFWQVNNATEFVGATTLTYGANFGASLGGAACLSSARLEISRYC
jgi:hypothetical protein